MLGGVASADPPLPVAGLARDMGVTRQAVQRIINDLERDGLVTFLSNPQHKRVYLVILTDRGWDQYQRALALQTPWAKGLSEGLSAADMETARKVLHRVLDQLAIAGDVDPD